MPTCVSLSSAESEAVGRASEKEMDDEEYVIEIVEWLEKAVRTSDSGTIARAMANGAKRTCKQISHDYSTVRRTGCKLLSFWLPMANIQADTGLSDSDVAALKEYVRAIPDNGIRVEVKNHWIFGECIVLRRYIIVSQEEGAAFSRRLPGSSLLNVPAGTDIAAYQ